MDSMHYAGLGVHKKTISLCMAYCERGSDSGACIPGSELGGQSLVGGRNAGADSEALVNNAMPVWDDQAGLSVLQHL